VRQVPVTEAGVRAIVENLRERDRAEIMALYWEEDLEALIRNTLYVSGAMCRIFEWHGVPVAIVGAAALWPGVWSGFAFGTDLWPHVVLDMTRYARRFIIPALLAVGAHRIECRALASYGGARNWIEALGGRQECTLHRFGKNQEDYVVYVWKGKDDVHRGRRGVERPLATTAGDPAATV
jgi:hypothetical protein